MSVQGARAVAYDVLRAVSADEAYANLLLPHAIVRAKLDAKDAGLATELTYGTLRRRGTYDAIIAAAADRTVDRIDPAVLDALRLGVHQLLSTRVASHAAVNESVELARRNGGGRGAAGFANAVLRRVSRENPGAWMQRVAAAARSDDERIGVTTSHPVWIVRALRRALTAEGRADELVGLLEADNVAPRVAMIALPGLAEVPVDATTTPYSPLAFNTRGGDPEGLIRASEGRIRVQDEGSQLAALALSRALPVREGERWLDLCAGPGGKTALLAAEALAHGARLDANEIAPARAGLVRQAVESVPLEVQVSEEDGRERAARMPGEYDRILVDAPCTGIGALRRRPEARWRKTPADVPDLTALQQELVLAAFEALKPGGVVAYVTCSPHLAETSGVLAEVKRELGNAVEELDARAVVRSVAVEEIDLPDQADGSLRAQLWPHRHGTDAMSIALLRKR
ncbi:MULTISPECIES: RsmB/NOP family class I SAM-dependent RNA methyltransferase [Microbacterium]|uniref:RsmB/NOP family class I SAM-dependent RNA methyltransferase n=1 Tax=Microbacterium TaxID=33882 RepID=UPI002789091B|nr:MULTISPECIES: transcription antitermination factor NusB [Microbacterium]MDQ1084289.1 16S rRNA (cytosine967-C5)-methyltransferase [Microbacterium sp. SORGH_AS_0344]MDQ1170435.1 16S rRNA (cytosine967-C5)-methyltransferase [Microbacterium proteolyticum]